MDFTKKISTPTTYAHYIPQFHKLQIDQPHDHSQLTFTNGSLSAGIKQRCSH